jgi:hypothetical protein
MSDPTAIPATLRSGDSWTWPVGLAVAVADYPADTWSLAYLLRSAADRFLVPASVTGGEAPEWRVSVAPAATALLAAGRYDWVLFATRLEGEAIAERRSLATGTVEIVPDPATQDLSGPVSHARRMLDAIESALEGRATEGDLDLIETAHNGRSARYDLAALHQLHRYYAARVAAEEALVAGTMGARSGIVQVQFR